MTARSVKGDDAYFLGPPSPTPLSRASFATPRHLQSDYKNGPGFIRFAGPRSLNLAGAGHVQIGMCQYAASFGNLKWRDMLRSSYS